MLLLATMNIEVMWRRKHASLKVHWIDFRMEKHGSFDTFGENTVTGNKRSSATIMNPTINQQPAPSDNTNDSILPTLQI